ARHMLAARRRTAHARHESAYMIRGQNIDRVHALQTKELAESTDCRTQRLLIVARQSHPAIRSARRHAKPARLARPPRRIHLRARSRLQLMKLRALPRSPVRIAQKKR